MTDNKDDKQNDNQNMNLKTYSFGPQSGGTPQNVVLMLHGYGADGRDLLGLAPELADDLPDTLFLAAEAPHVCEMSPFGRQWFSLRDWSPEAMLRGAREAAPYVTALIDDVVARYGVTADRIALLGFSQGTMMSLYAGPRYTAALAGIVGFSGAFLDDADAPLAHKIPVCLIHGMADPVVPVASYYQAREKLTAAGFTISGHVSPALLHAIDFQGIATARDFLKQIFGPSA